MTGIVRNGFTLIEVLVVIVIISVVMSAIVSGFTGADREQSYHGFVQRMAMRIEMARDRAVQTNHEWGLYVEAEAVRFAEFDPITGEWLERVERPFKVEASDDQFRYQADVERYAGHFTDDQPSFGLSNKKGPIPTIILFSSGEITPFELTITPQTWDSLPWILASDGFSRTKMSRDER